MDRSLVWIFSLLLHATLLMSVSMADGVPAEHPWDDYADFHLRVREYEPVFALGREPDGVQWYSQELVPPSRLATRDDSCRHCGLPWRQILDDVLR